MLALLAGAGRAQQPTPAPQQVVVGSKAFPESHLLGEMFTLLLEARGFEVEHRSGLGGTLVCFTALRSGEIDLYPEYTGTGWSVLLGEEEKLTDSLQAFLQVAARSRERFDVEWLDPLGPDNTYALAMRRERADELGIRSISDLTRQAGELRAAFGMEFMNRADGYPGLADTYGLEFADARSMEHALAYIAIVDGTVDVVDVYSTDGELLRYDLAVLEDDRAFFPPYDVAPLVNGESLRALPALRAALAPLAFHISDRRMMELNHAVQVEGRAFREVAREYLGAEGLLEGVAETRSSSKELGFVGRILSHRHETLGRLGEHLRLTFLSVLIAALLAIPLGIAVMRRPWAERLSLGLAGIAQTIPSLALLACLIAVPGFGLSARTAITALTLYAVLPVLRNTVTGLRSVDPDLIDAARGMGLEERQILLRIQLPLATRTIMAGIRTATVITVGFATLAAFIGAGGLGEPILNGLYLADIPLILSGALPAAALALAADALLGLLERRLTPRGLRTKAS